MKQIYLREVYLNPNMNFNLNFKFIKFLRKKLNEFIFIEKIPYRKGFKTDTSDYSLTLNINCHDKEFEVTGPTIYRKDKEIDFYLNIPYKEISDVKEQAIYLLNYLELGLNKILLDDAFKYDLKNSFSKINHEVVSIDNSSELLRPFKSYEEAL